jgi:arginyl-tRNA synthetase
LVGSPQAVSRAEESLKEHLTSDGMTPEERKAAIEAVAYGAVKYADLATTRTHDYVFSFDRMLSLRGNTGVYLLYAYVRMNSILRRAGVSNLADHAGAPVSLDHAAEEALGKTMLRFPEIVETITRDLFPHTLCEYLFELCRVVHDFVESCRVIDLDADGKIKSVNMGRLLLVDAATQVVGTGLQLLGLRLIKRM